MSRRLPFLLGCSLGQVCHIVQLAISQRRLLGYRNGFLCPYKHSEGWVKEQCAVAQAPTGQESCPPVTWEEAPALLRQLLSSHRQAETGGVSLSNLKRLFCLDFQRELSQTVLGHVRLLDLLKDPRLENICTLHAQSNGQVLVRAAETCAAAWGPVVPPGVWAVPMMTFFPLAEQTCPLPISPEVKRSTAFSVCTESTAGDIGEFDLSSDAACSDSSSSPRHETDDEESSDQWAVDVN